MHTLEVVPHDPRWPAAYDAEAARLRSALGPLAIRIDHHGSTAVSGLAAKPVVDAARSAVCRASLRDTKPVAGHVALEGVPARAQRPACGRLRPSGLL